MQNMTLCSLPPNNKTHPPTGHHHHHTRRRDPQAHPKNAPGNHRTIECDKHNVTRGKVKKGRSVGVTVGEWQNRQLQGGTQGQQHNVRARLRNHSLYLWKQHHAEA